MHFLRFINLHLFWERKRQNFNPEFFCSEQDILGISVIEKECSEEKYNSCCENLRKNYGKFTGKPIVYWLFNGDFKPDHTSIETTNSKTCHCEIKDFNSVEEAQEWYLNMSRKNGKLDLNQFYICEFSNKKIVERVLEFEDLENIEL